MSRAGSRALAAAGLIAAALAIAGCGGDSDDDEPAAPPSPAADPSAVEAAPEAPPQTTASAGEPGALGADDTAAVSAAVRAYIDALNGGQGDAVCSGLAPGAVELGELPTAKGGCAASVDASIGHRRRGGFPAWRRTKIAELKVVSVGGDTARVTATVTHDFADRKYNSIEEDVIYLERSGEEWLIAKPSGTFYRAVGYPEPPLRALTPP